ncbi:Cryptic asc operon repressor [Cedecea neteri]|uniref:Cryptic asc operon repressor n=1 Tax=Cedecea neteri TaxID=158822 RepID=A0A2X3IVX2_9ENTR|nr:Cryptic asc operon repressor [Cedecea neteri]
MSTMQEVAKKAGVSKATVSRVLSGKGYVSEATKTQVYQAIQETGVSPQSAGTEPGDQQIRLHRPGGNQHVVQRELF